MNVTNKVNKDDRDNARLDRDRVSNPPDFDPGMEDISWDDDFPIGGSSGGLGGSEPLFGNDFGGGFGGSSFGTGGFGTGGFGNAPFGSPQPPTTSKQDEVADKVWDATIGVFKGFFTFTKDLVESFKTFDSLARLRMGKSSIITGGIVTGAGAILTAFGFGFGLGIPMIIGGLLSVGVAVPIFMTAYADISKNGVSPQEPDNTSDGFGSFDGGNDGFADDSAFSFDNDAGGDSFTFDDDDDDEDVYFMDDVEEEEEEFSFSIFDDSEDPKELNKGRDEILSSIDVDKGMVTRSYLYEKMSASLESYNKSYDTVRTIKENSEEFDAWDAIIQGSAKIFAPKGNDVVLPYLVEAKEKVFYVQLEITRVSWIKNINSFVDEIVSICRYDKETGKTDMGIYGIGNAVGDRIYVKVMKGENTMLTVKDAYRKVEKTVLDTKNAMPVVLGLDVEGEVVIKDFKNINSVLVTGMPRSGKTWMVTSILSQMMFYLKPSELNLYILDPKDAISDFKYINSPHVRKFVSTDEKILSELRNIVKVEGPRRKKIIGDAGFVNIMDFKKKHPDVELPLLYVVIDEVITLAERMDSETKDEFQALLLELVSQLPALGIRIFMIPHVVKDQILKKSITDLIPCRISVMGDEAHVEKSVGVKNFKHKLRHQGDMAVRFGNDEVEFVHSAVLATDNDGNEDFHEFLLNFWSKIEPESLKGSLYEKREILEQNAVSTPKSDINMVVTNKTTNVVPKPSNKKLENTEIEELLANMSID